MKSRLFFVENTITRTARMVINDESTVYHVISRTTLDGYPFGDMEKEFFHGLLRSMALVYFMDIIGYCLMGNPFLLLVRTRPEEEVADEEIRARLEALYGDDRKLQTGQIPYLRARWCRLSEFMRTLKLRFTRFDNKCHGRRGYFWGDRYKSLLRPV